MDEVDSNSDSSEGIPYFIGENDEQKQNMEDESQLWSKDYGVSVLGYGLSYR